MREYLKIRISYNIIFLYDTKGGIISWICDTAPPLTNSFTAVKLFKFFETKYSIGREKEY